jgi:hypothetical protein
MEYMISGIENTSSWMFASNSEIAPTMDALMKTLIAVGDPVNTVVDLFQDYIEGSSDLYFNGDWEESFTDLNTLHTQIRMIPMQPGNEGRIQPDGNNTITVNTALTPTNTATTSTVAKPQPLGQVVEVQKQSIKPPTGGLSGMAVDEQSTRPLPPQPHPMQPPVYQPTQPSWAAPVGYPQPMHQQPVYPVAQQQMTQQPMPGTVVMVQTPMGPQQMMVNQVGQLVPMVQPQQFAQPQAQIQRTGRGIDFNSVLAANPHMAAQPMMHHPMMGYNQAPQAPAAPGWARPDTMNWSGF